MILGIQTQMATLLLLAGCGFKWPGVAQNPRSAHFSRVHTVPQNGSTALNVGLVGNRLDVPNRLPPIVKNLTTKEQGGG